MKKFIYFLMFLFLITSSFAALDVYVQDQTTIPIDYFFTQVQGIPTTVDSNVSVDDRNVTATNISSCSIGDYIGLFNSDNESQNRAFFATSQNIVGNIIVLDTPIDFNFKSGDTLACFSRELNVDGSVSPETFKIQVGGNADQCIDLTRILLSFKTSGAVDLNKFGDLPSLANGLVLRQTNGFSVNIWNVKNNGEIANLCYDYSPYVASNPSQGQNGAKFRYSFGGQDKHGVVLRICPGESLDLIVQDDLSGLDEFRVVAEGHYVDSVERDGVEIIKTESEEMLSNITIVLILFAIGIGLYLLYYITDWPHWKVFGATWLIGSSIPIAQQLSQFSSFYNALGVAFTILIAMFMIFDYIKDLSEGKQNDDDSDGE